MKPFINISEIDTNTKEGRYLLAALAKISTESQTDKEPDAILNQCFDLAEQMFEDDLIEGELIEFEPLTFEQEIANTINRHSKENGSHTPDFILGEYLTDCLQAFEKCSNAREKWYGQELRV